MKYRVIYYWRGERYVHAAWPMTLDQAKKLVGDFHQDGWPAHYEAVATVTS